MLGTRMVRLIEKHAESLVQGLVQKLRNSGRTTAFRNIPPEELKHASMDVYTNLGDWLLTKTESDIEVRYSELGRRRHAQGIPLSQLAYALMMSKEHLVGYLQREGLAEGVVELYSELELIQLLDHFFDHAVYFAIVGYEQFAARKTA